MINRFHAWLNGNDLESIHPSIKILDIQYSRPKNNSAKATVAARDGSVITSKAWGEAEAAIDLEVHCYNTQERMEVTQQIAQWAMQGGWLETSDRPGKRLHVACDVVPVVESALRWTEEINVSFISDGLPYWEDINPSSSTIINGKTGTGILFGHGYMPNFVRCEVVPSGALKTLTIAAGASFMEFTGFSIASGKLLEITYDDFGNLKLLGNGASILGNRTGASSDDLKIPACETSTVSVSANVSVKATFTARGLYL